MIKTRTQTGIRLRMLACQLKSVNASTVASVLLDRIINECVSEQGLAKINIYGIQNGVAYARMSVAIDYETHSRRIRIEGDGAPDRLCRGSEAYCERSSALARSGGEEAVECAVWREAIAQFCDLVRGKGLTLDWCVVFARDRDMYCARFGLVTSTIRDGLGIAPAYAVPNSFFAELSATFSFSEAYWPVEV